MQNQPVVSIVIPCRNEASTIDAVVRFARQALSDFGYSGEVVVVDNRSEDESAERAEAAGARVLQQPIPGYGAACIHGLSSASGEILVLVDGDGTYNLSELNRFVEPLKAGYEMVLGTRRNGLIRPRAMRKRHRHFLEPVQTALTRWFYHLRVSDVRCGFRSIRREALEKLTLGATGMEFASEMLIEAAKVELDAVEVPVTFSPRPKGDRRSIGDGWRVARQLLLLSPTRLFLLPGLVLLLLGVGSELLLLNGPLTVMKFTMDFHFMFIGGAVAILGTQLLLLGVYAKTWTLVNDPPLADPWIRWFNLHYTLERGVALGGLIFSAGLIINVWILAGWLTAGGGGLFAVRPATLALTLMVVGAELFFASFFLSVLRSPGFGKS
jgi:glycosyltransferase involved in cell wall biosynthesis